MRLLRNISETEWISRLRQPPRVNPGQARRISELAGELARELAPEACRDGQGNSPLERAAIGLAEYLDGNWEFPRRNNQMPQPSGWDPEYAHILLRQAMYAFDASSIVNPRDPGKEARAQRLAFQLAMAILETGRRSDPEGLLDMVTQGRIGEAPRPVEYRLPPSR